MSVLFGDYIKFSIPKHALPYYFLFFLSLPNLVDFYAKNVYERRLNIMSERTLPRGLG